MSCELESRELNPGDASSEAISPELTAQSNGCCHIKPTRQFQLRVTRIHIIYEEAIIPTFDTGKSPTRTPFKRRPVHLGKIAPPPWVSHIAGFLS